MEAVRSGMNGSSSSKISPCGEERLGVFLRKVPRVKTPQDDQAKSGGPFGSWARHARVVRQSPYPAAGGKNAFTCPLYHSFDDITAAAASPRPSDVTSNLRLLTCVKNAKSDVVSLLRSTWHPILYSLSSSASRFQVMTCVVCGIHHSGYR